MRLFKIFALVAALIGGALSYGSTSATAAPLAAGAGLATSLEGATTQVQYSYGYYPRGNVYRGRPYYGRPYYGRRYYGRPYYAPPRRAYRAPRVVCRTVWRNVRTAYGWQRRPVRVCNRRW